MYTLGIYIYIALVRLAALFGHRKAKLMLEGAQGDILHSQGETETGL